MKLHEESDVILGNNQNKATQFKIAASSKAFKILSSNLYKNKIRAVVRELVCNAVDAHTLNNSLDVPFDITVPTAIEPQFSIRDYGPGLSQEDMTELYTTYFASTKSHSDEFRGALGLGSKSPFSYTSAFTVISNFGGVKYTYNALLENGEPALYLVNQRETTDKHGIEIIIGVKIEDLNRWAQEIKYILRPFKEHPHNIIGSTIEPMYMPTDDVLSRNSDALFTQYSSSENYGLYAIYGNIVYPISSELIPIDGKKHPLIKAISYSAMYIKFDMGLLDIQPSREELSYDERTIANIYARLDEIELDAKKRLDEYIESAKTPRDIARRCKNLNYNIRNIDEITLPKLNSIYFNQENQNALLDVKQLCSVVIPWGTKFKKKHISSARTTSAMDPIDLMDPSRTYAIFEMDKRVSTARAEEIIEANSKLDNHRTMIFAAKDQGELVKQAFESISYGEDIVELYKASDFYVKPERKASNTIRPKTANVRIISDKSYAYNECMSAAEISELSGYYLGLSYDEYTDPDTFNYLPENTPQMKMLMDYVGVDKIYCIRKSSIKTAQANPNLMSFMEMIKKINEAPFELKSFKNPSLNSYNYKFMRFVENNPTVYEDLLEIVSPTIPEKYVELYEASLVCRSIASINAKFDSAIANYNAELHTARLETYKNNPLIELCITGSANPEALKIIGDAYKKS